MQEERGDGGGQDRVPEQLEPGHPEPLKGAPRSSVDASVQTGMRAGREGGSEGRASRLEEGGHRCVRGRQGMGWREREKGRWRK